MYMMRLQRNSPEPYYLQLKTVLRLEAAKGAFKPNEPLPTEVALAAQLGLSRMTVRRAIQELTAEGLFRRIRGRGTFVRDARELGVPAKTPNTASTETQRDTALIALIAPFERNDTDSVYFSRVIQSMEGACGERGTVLLRKAQGDVAAFVERLKGESRLSGIIALCMKAPLWIDALASSGMPIVLYDSNRPSTQTTYDYVTHANEEGAFAATSALLQLAHRDIALFLHDAFGDPPGVANIVSCERREGYERAIKAHGLPVDRERVINVPASGAGGYAAMRTLLNQKTSPKPTAVLCSTDEMAVGAIAAVKDHGWRVPNQMSVMGIGDSGFFCSPALSTMRVDIERAARISVDCLLERMANPRLDSRNVTVQMEYVARASADVARFE